MIKKRHDLKCWPEYFEQILRGRKTFELRKNDRDFQVDEWVILHEWDNKLEEYSGRTISFIISGILQGPMFGLEKGFCIMSFHYDLIRVFEPNN